MIDTSEKQSMTPYNPRRGLLRKTGHRLGLVSTSSLVDYNAARTALPDGYHHAQPSEISIDERSQLAIGAGWGYQTIPKITDTDRWLKWNGATRVGAGVRDAQGELVAYGALIMLDHVGELGDLSVHPDHRGNGLAKAVIDARLQQADVLRARSLVTKIYDTNNLMSYYLDHGFREVSGSWLGRGSNPTPLPLV